MRRAPWALLVLSAALRAFVGPAPHAERQGVALGGLRGWLRGKRTAAAEETSSKPLNRLFWLRSELFGGSKEVFGGILVEDFASIASSEWVREAQEVQESHKQRLRDFYAKPPGKAETEVESSGSWRWAAKWCWAAV